MEVISVIGMKGGCGKTTTSILLASTLAYKKKKKVVVLDCDTLQQSFTKYRLKDIEDITPYTQEVDGKEVKMVRDGILYKAFKDQNIKPFDIVRCHEDINMIIELLTRKDKEGGDYAILDLPGSIDNPDYFKIVSLCSIVFIPFIADDIDFASNFDFAKHTFAKIFAPGVDCNLKKMFGFWNRYDSTCRPAAFRAYCERIKQELPDLSILDNKIEFTKAIGNDRCRSTILPPFPQFGKYGNIDNTIEEMCNKIFEIDGVQG